MSINMKGTDFIRKMKTHFQDNEGFEFGIEDGGYYAGLYLYNYDLWVYVYPTHPEYSSSFYVYIYGNRGKKKKKDDMVKDIPSSKDFSIYLADDLICEKVIPFQDTPEKSFENLFGLLNKLLPELQQKKKEAIDKDYSKGIDFTEKMDDYFSKKDESLYDGFVFGPEHDGYYAGSNIGKNELWVYIYPYEDKPNYYVYVYGKIIKNTLQLLQNIPGLKRTSEKNELEKIIEFQSTQQETDKKLFALLDDWIPKIQNS